MAQGDMGPEEAEGGSAEGKNAEGVGGVDHTEARGDG